MGTASAAILIVDDHASIRGALRTMLEQEGYEVAEAASGAEMMAALDQNAFDLMTLDLSVGRENGLELMKQAKARQSLPVLLVTAKGDDVDRIVGLELGADDYIVKPFNLREVLARIWAVLRRVEAPHPPPPAQPANPDGVVSRFSGWSLDARSRELRSETGQLAALTSAEFDLLEALVRRPSRVLSREALIDLTKGPDSAPFDRAIDTLIGRLRKKIEADPDNPALIKTIRGVGYVFSPGVQ